MALECNARGLFLLSLLLLGVGCRLYGGGLTLREHVHLLLERHVVGEGERCGSVDSADGSGFDGHRVRVVLLTASVS